LNAAARKNINFLFSKLSGLYRLIHHKSRATDDDLYLQLPKRFNNFT